MHIVFILTLHSCEDLIAILGITYASAGVFLIRATESKYASEKIPARRVFAQSQTNFLIIIVFSLTPIFNIFVLPYLALIVPFLLLRFSLRGLLSGFFG